MIYSKDVEKMCTVAKGVNHGPAPIPEEGKWVKAKEITKNGILIKILLKKLKNVEFCNIMYLLRR